MDIARGLNARIADAERIKTLYGSVLAGGSDERDMVTVPPLSEDEREQAQFVSRAALVGIIKPRVEEILEMVRDRLAAYLDRGRAARPRHPDRRREPVHRTAGSCVADSRPASARSGGRSASPERRSRPKAQPSPSPPGSWFIRKLRISSISRRARKRQLMTGTGGYFTRVGQWLRESF